MQTEIANNLFCGDHSWQLVINKNSKHETKIKELYTQHIQDSRPSINEPTADFGPLADDYKMSKLLMPKSDFTHDGLILPKSCEKYVTCWKISLNIALKLKKMIGRDSLVIDATANIGGITTALAKHFRYVAAYEINPDYFRVLEHNVNCYNFKNVTLINEDFTTISQFVTKPRAMIIDPPWYKHGASFNQDMNLSEVPLTELLTNLFTLCPDLLILVKLPDNYPVANYASIVFYKKMKFVIYDLPNWQKFNLDKEFQDFLRLSVQESL